MTSPHPQWPHVSVSVYYEDAAAVIDWLSVAFGLKVRLRIEDDGGNIIHSELTHGDGVIMVGQAGGRPDVDRPWCRSPKSLDGANTQTLCLYVDEVDAHCERARAAGAVIEFEPTTDDYGEEYGAHRSYRAVDPEGHQWWFMSVVRDPQNV